jgi:hypothetical protein
MTEITAFAIIIVSGLIHASFQLSVSMVTLLSSHTIGRKRSRSRLLQLTTAFAVGTVLMTMLLLTLFASLTASLSSLSQDMTLLWTMGCGLLAGVGIAVWLFYYRREAGTSLWVPRAMARYLSSRVKATHQSAEAFGLGLSSVIAELLFTVAPLAIAALALTLLAPTQQLIGVAIYGFVSLMPLLLIIFSVNNGVSISRIQKWRESNKGFLQFAAGSGLVVLGFYIYVEEVVAQTAMAAARSL